MTTGYREHASADGKSGLSQRLVLMLRGLTYKYHNHAGRIYYDKALEYIKDLSIRYNCYLYINRSS
jgi:hypothetical protein